MVRHGAELNSDDRNCFIHTLTCAHVERNSLPAPVVNEKLNRSESIYIRSLAYIRFLPVAGHFLAFYPAGTILATYGILMYIFRFKLFQCIEHIHLLIAYFISIKRYR